MRLNIDEVYTRLLHEGIEDAIAHRAAGAVVMGQQMQDTTRRHDTPEDALVVITRIQRDLKIVTWMVAINIALMLSILGKVLTR